MDKICTIVDESWITWVKFMGPDLDPTHKKSDPNARAGNCFEKN